MRVKKRTTILAEATFRRLIQVIDDQYAIMGAGDELMVQFDGRGLAPSAPGWVRGFILVTDGWHKKEKAPAEAAGVREPNASENQRCCSADKMPQEAVRLQGREMIVW